MKNKQIINVEQTNEISVAKLRANYGCPALGYKEKEADELRAKILLTGNTEEYYEIKGNKYYVSVNGDDNNNGLSPETPIKSLDRIETLELQEGDAILFKRGDVFRFARTVELKNGITYGSYGEGVKPRIYGSPENYAQNKTWKQTNQNVWEIEFNYAEACGCVLDYSQIIGVNKKMISFTKPGSVNNLTEEGDYFHDNENGIFYLCSPKGNPCEVYEDIEIMPSTSILTSKNGRNIVVDNLTLKYSAGFALSAVFFKSNLKFTNCETGFIGGLWTNKERSNRFGNAIEFWCGANDVEISNNWFYQTYDSAVTWQGNVNTVTYKNISYTGNLFEYNNCDIEFFDKDNVPLENYVMANNIMRSTSMGWGSRTYDGGMRGIEGCIRAVTCSRGEKVGMDLKSAYFTDNILDCPARQTINWNIDPHQRKAIHANGTKLYIKSEYRTLAPCLQGLQTDWSTQAYDRRFACTPQELKENFPLFEDGAEIYWDGEKV